MIKVSFTDGKYKIGNKFGRLTIRGPKFSCGLGCWKRKVICECACGNFCAVQTGHLHNNNTTSCGCFRSEESSKRKKIHGERHTPLYQVWLGMRKRCNDTSCKSYKDYGGRGIAICREWDDSYISFRAWALRNGYDKKLQIDRRNNSLGYRPDNCRFVTILVNANNKRNNHWVRAWGEEKTIAQWTRDIRCVVSRATLSYRVRTGWNPEKALTVLPLQ